MSGRPKVEQSERLNGYPDLHFDREHTKWTQRLGCDGDKPDHAHPGTDEMSHSDRDWTSRGSNSSAHQSRTGDDTLNRSHALVLD